MTKALRLYNEALEELESAAEWYEARRKSLGIEFVWAVREALQRIASSPQTCPLIPDVPERLAIRRFVLRRFPYSVVFVELDDEIRVLAIAHAGREPGFWRDRV